MINKEWARANFRRAEIILREAQRLYTDGAWNLVIRRSQEAVELCIKGALRYAGLEVPKLHDVSSFLKRNKVKFPQNFQEEIPRLVSISRRLWREREISIYGDEAAGLPAEELYYEEDAKTALEEAQLVLRVCKKLTE